MGVDALAARLPDVPTLRRWSVGLAALDAILCPDDWDARYFSFDPRWGDGEEMASMRNGAGDEYSIVFSRSGVFIRGFDHESALTPQGQSPPRLVDGLVDDVPEALRHNVTEPAFSSGDVPAITVCLWREPEAADWRFGTPADEALRHLDGGASWLFEQLDGDAGTYVAFARDYHERDLDVADVRLVLDQEPLGADALLRLNPDLDSGACVTVAAELSALGYPARA